MFRRIEPSFSPATRVKVSAGNSILFCVDHHKKVQVRGANERGQIHLIRWYDLHSSSRIPVGDVLVI